MKQNSWQAAMHHIEFMASCHASNRIHALENIDVALFSMHKLRLIAPA
jgi:hypothetical protein